MSQVQGQGGSGWGGEPRVRGDERPGQQGPGSCVELGTVAWGSQGGWVQGEISLAGWPSVHSSSEPRSFSIGTFSIKREILTT